MTCWKGSTLSSEAVQNWVDRFGRRTGCRESARTGGINALTPGLLASMSVRIRHPLRIAAAALGPTGGWAHALRGRR